MIKDKSDNLPLHLACKSGNAGIVKELLRATVEDKSKRGMVRKIKLQRTIQTSLEKRYHTMQVHVCTYVIFNLYPIC